MRDYRAAAGRSIPIAALVLFFFPAAPSFGAPSLIRVPANFPMISQAVDAAKDGDVIEVDDGFYFEKNIVIDKAVTLRSKNLYGAVVAGSDASAEAIFIVRAACRIENFILKSARTGILQRNSPDVEWEGRHLALFRMERGIAIDDREYRRGAARLVDTIVDGCSAAFVTNDARGFDISRVLVVNAETVFVGSNHLSFIARNVVAWNCRSMTKVREGAMLPPPSTDRIILEPQIHIFDSKGATLTGDKIQNVLNRIFRVVASDPEYSGARSGRREALLLLIAGDLFSHNRNWRASAAHYRRALETDPAAPRGEIGWRALLGLSAIAEAAGNPEEAVVYLKRAVDVVEMIGATIPVQAFQSGFRGDKIGIYEDLIGQLIILDRINPGQGYDREALWYAEKSRARGFMIGLKLLSPPPAEPNLKEREALRKALSHDVTRLQLRLQDAGLSAEERTSLLDRLDRTERNRSAQILDMRRRDLESGRFRFPDPFRLEDIRTKLLGPDSALLEYVLGEKDSFAFLVTSDSLDIAVLPPDGEIRPLVSRYLQFLTLRETGEFRGREGSRILAGILLEPFRSRLSRGVKSLDIVPDGALHYLPFETLLLSTGGRERFLVEEFEITYGPSASGLIRLAERPEPASFSMDFLGFANTLSRTVFAFSEKVKIAFPELPFGVREIRAIRDLYPRVRTTGIWGDGAREDQLKSLPLADYRVIHLVAHGVYDDRNWQRSALLLQPDENGREDGFLQANDIFGLKLCPELLVLSGCQTGTGYLQKGEGLTGLASAFFYAGAQSILMSLWNVNDKATSVFMESFYRHFASGMGKAESLRRAKMKMLKSSYRHPFYWAPFVLQGK